MGTAVLIGICSDQYNAPVCQYKVKKAYHAVQRDSTLNGDGTLDRKRASDRNTALDGNLR